MSGYVGKCVSVDLTRGSVVIEDTPKDLCDRYLGGRGIGVALVAGDITRSPYDPAMPLVFATGPLVGTATPTSGRMAVVSRSPLTGTVFDCSVGGRFGTQLKRAGFDFFTVTGRADDWSVLTIRDGTVMLEKAPALEGENLSGIARLVPKEDSYAAIGTAGERLVRFASIVVDGHYNAGRGGLGAVMGAKRLKLIRVRGSGNIPVADPVGLEEARGDIMRLLRASPAVFGEFGLAEFGTAALVDLIHARRMEPTENFRKTFFPNSSDYSGYRLKTRYGTKRAGCAGCPILCKKRGAGGEVMPEYETVSHFGALNGCSDPAYIVEANRLCNDLGLDTISAASTLACHGEITGKCLQPSQILEWLPLIASRSGTGDELAEGSLRYAAARGRGDLSMTVKGLELPAYDPRGAYGMALAYATSNRGGCHLRAYPVSHEILRKPVATDRFSFEGKARIIRIAEDMNAVVDSLTACKFVFFASSLEEYAKAVNAVTGGHHHVQSLLSIGEEIWKLERRLNESNGFTARDDDLPRRFFTEEGSSGGAVRIPPIDRASFLAARERYYSIRGFDGHAGAARKVSP
ncbi:MAG TPA: aldehyde ferredoxin oxidoreductase family protein [Dissulfurispiraceae bacterium]|nr:aldehyde ferredoxin oxidoreductase family protein [Dissulfurispiraceae bacterium]